MKVIIPGHQYSLANLESGDQTISFIRKDIKGDSTDRDPTRLETVQDGTTNEQVLLMLIDRLNYLQTKMPCRENALVITKLEEALHWLNARTERRIDEGKECTNIV